MKKVNPPKISSSRNKLSSKTNPLETAATLAEKRLKGGQENYDPYNSVIGEVSGQLSEGLKGPKNDIGSFASGLFQGINNVTKFNKMFESDKKYQEYQKVLDYFQEVNNQKLQQQQYHDKLENAQEQLRPMALAYFGNQKKDPQTAFISGQQMWNKYKELTGEPGEFLGWTPLDQNIAMIQHDGEVDLLDIRPLLLGDQYTENQIAALDQDYQNKLQEERQRYDQEMALEDRKVRSGEALNRKRMDVYDAQINKLNTAEPQPIAENETPEDDNIVPLEKMGKKFAEEWQKMAAKEISQIPMNERALETTGEMRKVFKKYPNIGSSFVNVLLNGGSMKGWINAIGRQISNKEELAAAEELEKLSGDLNLATVLGMPAKAVTDILKNTIAKASPSGHTTYEAFNAIADSWDKRADYNIRRAKLIENDISRGNYRRNLGDSLRNTQSQMVQKPMQSSMVQKTTENNDYGVDENGEKIKLTPEQFNALKSKL